MKFKFTCLPVFSLAVIAGALVFACSEDKTVFIPENILSKEEYAKVLTDLSLAESAANLNIKNVRIDKIDSAYAFDPLKENGVSKSKYDSTALFYAEHPDLYNEVYDQVLTKLSEMQSAKKTVTDSVKK